MVAARVRWLAPHMHIHAALPEFFHVLGMSVVETSPERAVLRMDVPTWFRSPFDQVHGGAIAAFMDTTFGAALAAKLSPQDRMATHELNVNYLSFAREHTLLCTARVLAMGQAVATVEGEVETEAGRLIAKALGTFGVFLRRKRTAT